MVAGISSLFCILLLALLFAISNENLTQETRVQSKDIIELLATPPQHEPHSADIDSSDIGIELPKGGWVQQTDSKGRLVQQYRCVSLDPDPPGLTTGWIEMKEPEVELFLGDNKLIRVTGNSGIANAPHRILESGEIAGNVIVKMFEIDQMSSAINPVPLMELHTEVAAFDNFIGEITCPSEVTVTSPSQTLVGRQLSLRFNDLEERIEYLHLAELDYIELLPAKASPNRPKKSASIISSLQPSRNVPDKHRIRAAAAGEEYEYYIVTLSDNVNIIQGNQLHGRLARGKTLTIAFSNKSKSSSSSSKQTTSPQERQPPMHTPLFVHSIPATIAAASLAYSQPALNDQPVRITCDGSLLMLPLEDTALMPSIPTDTRIELFAFDDAPAQLIDIDQGMTARGSIIRYELERDRSDLFGNPATLLMDDMLTSSNHLWIARQDGIGGADGKGTMESVTETPPSTSLTWSEGVDFSFNPTSSEEQGAIKEVVCHGDVVLLDKQSELTCSTLTVSFEQDADGASSPSLAVASGGVKALSDSQTMWADDAEVTFTKTQEDVPKDDDSMFLIADVPESVRRSM